MNINKITIWVVIFMFFLFIYFLTTGNPEYMFTDGRHVALPDYRFIPNNSPERLKQPLSPVLKAKNSSERSDDRSSITADLSKSPYLGYVNNSGDVKIHFKNSNNKNEGYKFKENGRKFGSIGNKLCCKIIEEYLGREVKINYRPDFLKNPETKRNLELDIYDELTKIAAEYNGLQHYKRVPKFQASDKIFEKQRERDLLKIELCEKEGVNLIIIPYTVDAGKKNKKGEWMSVSVPEYIREQKLKTYITQYLDDILKV
jgi:hypothetical protein